MRGICTPPDGDCLPHAAPRHQAQSHLQTVASPCAGGQGLFPATQVGAPEGHVSIQYRWLTLLLLDEGWLRMREHPLSLCPPRSVQKDVPGIHKTTGQTTLQK